MREGRDWLNRTLALRDSMPISVLAEALAGAAHLAIYDRDLEAAQSWAEELQTRTLAEPHAYGSYWAGRLLARFAINRHDWVTAKAMLAQASHAACSIPNPESGRSQALTAIAEFDDLRGDVQGALDHFRQALELGRISGNPHAITTAAIAYARLLRRQGELHYPASLLCEVLEHALGLRSFGLGNGAISELAYLALRAGQLERAVSYLAVADNLCPNSIAALNPYYGSYECVLAEARASLSTDAFSGAWEAGTMLTWQEAIAESRAFVHDLATLTEADSSLSVN
jgi:tetratricopeptide (TPR) repeat protein